MWEESAGVEREAVVEEQEGRISGGGDMANDLSSGDLDSDFDVESEEEEEGGNGGGESDINGDDTISQCTNGYDTDDHGVGDNHPKGAAIGLASRKRGRSPTERVLMREHEEEEEEEEDEEEEVEDDGFSEDLEDENGNRLADRNCTSVDGNDDAFFRGAVLEGDDEDGGVETAINPASSLYAASLYASSLSAHPLAQAPINPNALSAAANGLGFDISTNRLMGLRRFLEVAGARDADGRGAADTCSGREADVAVEGRADVERSGEAAAHAPKADVAAAESTTEGLLPDEVILEIIARVSDARARNCCALVSRRWRMSERLTRTSLSVRRSLADLLELPRCFSNVRRLDLSLCPPCGQPLLLAGPALEVATTLRAAFPRVTSLRVHVRDRNDVQCVAATWPGLEHVALIRWHEFSAAEAAAAAAGAAAGQGANNNNTDNPNMNANPLGTLELTPLLVMCSRVESIDLSEFTCFPDHVTDAFTAAPQAAAAIAAAAAAATAAAAAAASATGAGGAGAAAAEPSSKPPRAPLPRPSAPISSLRHLNLLKSSPGAFKASDVRTILSAAGRTLLSFRCLVEFDPRLSDSLSDETLIEIAERCPLLTALQLVDSSLWAAPSGLSLALGDHDDALPPDMDARVTPGGIRSFLARLLGLEELDLRPAQYLRGADLSLNLKRLRLGQLIFAHNDSLAPVPASGEDGNGDGADGTGTGTAGGAAGEGAGEGMVKQAGGRRRLEGRAGTDGTEELLYGSEAAENPSTAPDSSEWPALQSLTLLAPLGTLLSQLPSAGLLHCPLLSHVHIRVYGDCRLAAGPGAAGFGLSCLAGYPALRFLLRLDLTQVVGHSLSCPPGLAFDVMAWERFYLHGIQLLPGLESLHYWPPSDCDLNRRSMSMPSAGILASCQSLRHLAVHCTTANEHLLNVVVRGARGMRDLHVLGDCYPAPPDDTYAGMLRPASFQRLIRVLDERGYPD
ncbi:unnamed protein product [Closterium sp. Yama58-4]|nr:unnamed protein product [Closterium sp. Yama58-4]